MLANNDISQRQYTRAVSAPLGLRPGRLYSSNRHPNFFGWAEQQLVHTFGARRVEAGGLQVRTTLDPRMQNDARAAIASTLVRATDPAAALVAIDPTTGAVKAMLGYLPGGGKLQFNLATQSGRTAGSAFKPFVLATAIDQGISLYSAFSGPPVLTIADPACSTNGVPWTVHNYADESAGYMNLLDATANSVNTIFAQLVTMVGASNVATTAHQMGITTPLQSVCSITLGTQPVNPLEMTDAYATLAARGVHHDPHAFELVRGPSGQLIGALSAGRSAGDPTDHRRPGHLRARGSRPTRHRHRRRPRHPARRRQDRHRRELHRRLVLRLHPTTRRLRLDRLPKGGDPALQHRRRPRRVRRLPPRGDLEPLHDQQPPPPCPSRPSPTPNSPADTPPRRPPTFRRRRQHRPAAPSPPQPPHPPSPATATDTDTGTGTGTAKKGGAQLMALA